MIEAGFFDLDKTTIDEHGHAYEGLRDALDARPEFAKTVVTARGYPRFWEAISQNPSLAVSPEMPVALENGARIVDGETYENLYYHALSPGEQATVCDFIDKLEGLRYVAFHPQEPRAKTLLWSPDGAEAERLRSTYSHNAIVFTSSKRDLYREIKHHNPCMITCRTYEDDLQELPEITFYSRGTTVNFMPDGPNKGTAMQIIADMRGIDLSRAMAVGNDHNDEPMLTLEGLAYPVVVGNDMTEDMIARLPEHTTYIPDPKKLGNFILKEVQK
ncbi:MAG TPA: HAD hydrolase family protein [Candidatus Saccharimonas sp.]|nr:HAD hydrolase family protein [Candidatus Saccharimonas sp.]